MGRFGSNAASPASNYRAWVVNFRTKAGHVRRSMARVRRRARLAIESRNLDSRRTEERAVTISMTNCVGFSRISGQFVRPSRSCGCRCRRAKNRSSICSTRDFLPTCTTSSQVGELSGTRCCVRPARWRWNRGVSGYRSGIPELKERIAPRSDFMRQLPQIRSTRRKERSGLTFRNVPSGVYGQSLLLTFSVPQSFSRPLRLRPAPLGRSRQEGFLGTPNNPSGWTRYISPGVVLRHIRRRATAVIALELFKALTGLVLAIVDEPDRASFVIGPRYGMKVSPIVSST